MKTYDVDHESHPSISSSFLSLILNFSKDLKCIHVKTQNFEDSPLVSKMNQPPIILWEINGKLMKAQNNPTIG